MTFTQEIAQSLHVNQGKGIIKRILEKIRNVPYIPYPVSLQTVDIAAYRIIKGDYELLLGRRKYRMNTTFQSFQFLGGFVEPGETLEMAALRELEEESSINQIYMTKLKYIKSYFIDDSRYKNSCHKITTSFFKVEIANSNLIAIQGRDDIEEVRWIKFENAQNFLMLRKHLLLRDFFKVSKN